MFDPSWRVWVQDWLSCTRSDKQCNLSHWRLSETVFKKGGCYELRNDRSLMMWLLGSTDVKILTRTHSVRTQGTGMKKGSSSWWRPVSHIYGETRRGKKSERCSCTSWSSTVLLQTYDSINLPCTHRSSWFDKRRSKKWWQFRDQVVRIYYLFFLHIEFGVFKLFKCTFPGFNL